MIARMALLVSGALLLGGSAAARESNPALGVEFHCNWGYYTDGTRATVVDRAVGAGLTWVRIDVSWRGLEPHRRKFAVRYGTRFERCVALAKRRGLRVLVVLGWTPKWANGGRKTNVPPRRASDYGVIATRLATRLRGRVDAWEVWNEPNLVDGWTGTPETYARLRRRALTIWLRADPEDHWNRVVQQGDRRPMAEHPEAMAELRRLLAARQRLYSEADGTVDTSRLGIQGTVRAVERLLPDGAGSG